MILILSSESFNTRACRESESMIRDLNRESTMICESFLILETTIHNFCLKKIRD